MSLQKHPEKGLTILLNTEAELVGSGEPMRDQHLIPDLEYVDDMCLLISSMDELEEIVPDLYQSCKEMGLSMQQCP